MRSGSRNDSGNGGFDAASKNASDSAVVTAQSLGELGVEVVGAGIGDSEGDAEQLGPLQGFGESAGSEWLNVSIGSPHPARVSDDDNASATSAIAGIRRNGFGRSRIMIGAKESFDPSW
jgi:hypothetical protein